MFEVYFVKCEPLGGITIPYLSSGSIWFNTVDFCQLGTFPVTLEALLMFTS